MRKTSHEGGDSTSVTSGVENEIKKSGAMKSKRNSIKKKVPVFSQESDITVTEPLLQRDKEGVDYADQSANEIISQVKTETNNKDERDGIIMLENNVSAFDGQSLTHTINENIIYKPQPNTIGAMHNHMNTNVFNTLDSSRNTFISKNQILVDIDGCKQVSYSSNPLIFTTAKIHSDGKNKHMEPVQVTPVPILSTVEVSVSKEGKCSDASSNLLQTITSVSDTNFNRGSKNTVPFTSHNTSIYKDTISKSVISVTTQENMINRIIVTNCNTEDSIKARKTTQSDLLKSVSTINYMENILLPTSQVSVVKSSTTLKNGSNVSAIKSPIVHSTVTETILTDSKLSTTFKEMSTPSEIIKPTNLKNMEAVNSQLKNNQGMCNVATNQSVISNNNKKDVSGLTTHKILPRQKYTITENLNELVLKTKYVKDGTSDHGSGNKNARDCFDTKDAPMKPTIFERDSSSISDKILPKTSTNNVSSSISKLPKSTAITEITEHSANIISSAKTSKATVPLYSPSTIQNNATIKIANSNNTSSNQNMNILSSPPTKTIDTNKLKITKPSSMTTTSLSSVNVSPIISSISQHTPTVEAGTSSKITKPSPVITTSSNYVNVSSVISSTSQNTPIVKPGPSSKITKPSSVITTSSSSVNVSPVISSISQNNANGKPGPSSKITNPSSVITTSLSSANVSPVISSISQNIANVKPGPPSKITNPSSSIATYTSSANVSPLISSISQNTAYEKPGPSSKITNPSSVITTSLSSANVSPVISSISQNIAKVNPGPSSKITNPSSVKTTSLSSVNVSPVISSTSPNNPTVKPGSSSKITKSSSFKTTSLSSVNVSSVTSSTSQNVPTAKPDPSSNTVKTISFSTTADKSSTSLATPLSTSKSSKSKVPSSSLSSDKQLGPINNTVMKSTENNIEGQSKLSVTSGTKSKDFSKDVKSVKS